MVLRGSGVNAGIRSGCMRPMSQLDAATQAVRGRLRGRSVLRVRLVERTPHEPLDEDSDEGSDGGVVELAMEAADPALQVGS